MLKIYTLSSCDSCRVATRWLRAQNIPFEERPIRESPPTPAELRDALVGNGGQLRKLFNTAGRDYREHKFGEKLAQMSVPAAIGHLAANGNLVKRPFLVGAGVALAGFNAEAWTALLVKK